MPARNAIAIDIGRQRLRAILADCDRNRVTVKRLLVDAIAAQRGSEPGGPDWSPA